MKKIKTRLSAMTLLAALILGLGISASAAGTTTINAELRPDITIVVDGVERTFYNVSGQEVHPILYNGTTYLPVRAIGELMGKNVNWDQDTLTATLSGTRTTAAVTGTPDTAAERVTVSAQLREDFTIVVDGVTRTFADATGARVYPLLYNGSIYLPVRAIGELMGKTVTWDSATQTVDLSSSTDSLVTDADSFSGTGTSTSTSTGTLIGVEAAQTAALNHAGLTASQVTFVQQKLDWEDGRQVYEIEFYDANYNEYDYEIDAYTGAVVSFDYDAEHYTQSTTSTGTYIGETKATEIALAQVSGATASHVVKCKLDLDDGRWEYEVEIRYNNREYEFEIDAYTGTIISWDVDR